MIDGLEDLIQLCRDFIDLGEDEEVWQRHLKTCEGALAKVERLREQFKLAYDWVDMQFPDGGMVDFAKYIGE